MYSWTPNQPRFSHEAACNARESSNKKVPAAPALNAKLEAATARPNNARARREPDSPMPQACPEDIPVSSSSKSNILKFFFFPAEPNSPFGRRVPGPARNGGSTSRRGTIFILDVYPPQIDHCGHDGAIADTQK